MPITDHPSRFNGPGPCVQEGLGFDFKDCLIAEQRILIGELQLQIHELTPSVEKTAAKIDEVRAACAIAYERGFKDGMAEAKQPTPAQAKAVSRMSRKVRKRNAAREVGVIVADRVKCLHSTQRCYASYSDNARMVHAECWDAYATREVGI